MPAIPRRAAASAARARRKLTQPLRKCLGPVDPDQHGVAVEQFRGGRVAGHLSLVHDDDPVRDLLDLLQVVAGDQDAVAAGGVLGHPPAQVIADHRIQRIRRLVEDQHPRLVDQGQRERETLPHTHRELADLLVRGAGQAHQVEHRRDPGIRHAGQGGRHFHRGTGTPLRRQRRGVERRRDQPAEVADPLDRVAAEGHPARIRPDQPDGHPHQRRLAGAVVTDQAEHHPRLHVYAHLAQGLRGAEPLTDAIENQHAAQGMDNTGPAEPADRPVRQAERQMPGRVSPGEPGR